MNIKLVTLALVAFTVIQSGCATSFRNRTQRRRRRGGRTPSAPIVVQEPGYVPPPPIH